MIKNHLVCLLIMTILVSCQSNSQEGSLLPSADELYEPSEKELIIIKNILLEEFGDKTKFERFNDSNSNSYLDFFEHNRNWIAAITTVRNDSSCNFHPVVGYHSNKFGWFRYRNLIDSNYTMSGETLKRYTELLSSDSLWVYFGEDNFWLDSNKIMNIYIDNHFSKKEPERWGRTNGTHMDLNEFDPNKNIQLTPEFWEFYSDSLADLVSGRKPFNDKKYEGFEIKQDYFYNDGRWYAAIISKRNDSEGVYHTIVGKIETNSFCTVFKILNEDSYSLYGDKMNSYIEAKNQNTLSKYLNKDVNKIDSLKLNILYEGVSEEYKHFIDLENLRQSAN